MKKAIIGVAVAFALGAAVHLTARAPGQTQTQEGQQQPGARGPVRGGRGGGFRGPNFPQQTRTLASPEVIARGKALYGVHCSSCHGSDLRGGEGGPNLLISQVLLSDQHGERVIPIVHGARAAQGMPALSLPDADVVDISEYIHSVLAQVGRQGRPPGGGGGQELQVIVGDPAAGKAFFDRNCASCHSVTGDLAGIATKYSDPRTLQNTWVSGRAGGGRGFGAPAPSAGGKPTTVTVTLVSGQTVEGELVTENDFVVTLIEADGTRRSFARNGNVKSVVVHDPGEAHKNLIRTLNDKEMHDVTAYLATIK